MAKTQVGIKNHRDTGGTYCQLAREIGSAKPAYISRGWGHSVARMAKSPLVLFRCSHSDR